MNENWNGILGQQAVKDVLDRLINSSKIPHALLFNGIEGIGKDFVAIKFAQLLNLKFAPPESSQNIVSQIANLSEPYIKYIFPIPRGKNETDNSGPTEKLSGDDIQLLRDEVNKKIGNPYYKIKLPKANYIKISSIRDIKKFLAFNYSDIKYRIILISEAHLMNEEAQNALLKNLEEPPDGVIFILTTSYPGLLRETIRSRCWTLNFQPLSFEDIETILINNYSIDKQIASDVAPFASGSIETALKLLDYDFELLREKTIMILRYSFGRKYHSALSELTPLLSDSSAETIKLLIQMIIIWLNDIQKFRYNSGEYFFNSHNDTLEKFNKKFPDVQLNEIVYKLDKLSSLIKNNLNLNLIGLNIIFELAALTSPTIVAKTK